MLSVISLLAPLAASVAMGVSNCTLLMCCHSCSRRLAPNQCPTTAWRRKNHIVTESYVFIYPVHSQASSDRFMAALRAEEARSSGGIVQLSDGNFAERVFESDRPYHKVVLFNTRDVRHNCGQCDSFRSEIEMVATAIRKAREDSPDAAPIHIFEADYSANRKMFEKVRRPLAIMPLRSFSRMQKGAPQVCVHTVPLFPFAARNQGRADAHLLPPDHQQRAPRISERR